MYINNGDISLNGRLFVSNDVSLNSRLTVFKDVSLNNRLFVGGDVSINSRLFVGNDTIIYGRLSVNEYQSTFIINTTTSNYTLIISEDMSLNGNLYVLKDASLNSRLFVGGDVSLNSRLIVYSDTSLNSRLFVGGDVSLNSRLTVYSDTSLNGLLFVGKDVSMNGNVYISGNVRIGTNSFIYGISGQIYALDVSGISNFRNTVNPISLIDNSVLFTNTPDFDFYNNFGILWTKNANSIQSFWTSIAVSATGQYQIACNGSVDGNSGSYTSGYLYISNNYGVTWNQVNLSVTYYNSGGSQITVSTGPFYSVSVSSTGQYMIALLNAAAINGYALTTNSNYTYCVYTSNNYGVTWKTSNIQYKLCYASAISATGQYQIFIQNNMNDNYTSPANNIYISFDYGNTFSSYGNINYMTDVAMSATGQYVTITQGTSTGYIYTSNNFGVTWKQLAVGANWNNVAMSSSGQYQYASVYNGIIYFSNNYGASWVGTGYISGIWSSLSVTADGKCVVACINGGGIYTSSNYGSNWLLSNSPNNSWNSVSISSNGKYITGCASTYNNNNRAADYIYNSVTPFENLSISNVLNNLNDTSLNNRLFVGGDVSMNSRLYVKNNILVGNISNIVDFSSTTLLTLSSGNPGNTGATIQLYGGGSKGSTVNINFDTYYSPTKGKIPATIIQAIDNGLFSNDLTFWTTNTGSLLNTPAERMRITGNGYVGIGITNPSQVLDVSGYIRVSGPNPTGSDTVGIEFVRGNTAFGTDVYTDWRIYNSAGTLRYLMSDTGIGTYERMCITADGKVGIGTNSPACQLHIASSSSQGIEIDQATSTNSNYIILNTNSNAGRMFIGMDNASGTGLFGSGDAYGACIGSIGATSLSFATNNNIRVKIDSTGNVGIGTNSPSYKLDVNFGSVSSAQARFSSSGSDTAISLYNTATSGREYWVGSAGSGAGAGEGNFYIYDNTSKNIRMVINSSGNVGIGTTSPSEKLVVNGTIIANTPSTDDNTTKVATTAFVKAQSYLTTSTASSTYLTQTDAGTTYAKKSGDTFTGSVTIGSSSTVNPSLKVNGLYGTSSSNYILFGVANAAGNYSSSAAAGDCVVRTGGNNLILQTTDAGASQLYLSSAGKFGIGNTSPTEILTVTGNISASGTVSSGSDYRIKTNITPIIDPSITTLVLNPVTYQRKDNDSSKREYGFIAHEVQEHYPELVTGYKDQVDASGNIITQTLNYLGIIPIAVHDIIQLNKEIQSLKQKNTELENRLALLEQRFTQSMI